jgi:hypothetical protein
MIVKRGLHVVDENKLRFDTFTIRLRCKKSGYFTKQVFE